MKKKCFNDKYGQTEAVLNGQKTMFREILKPQPRYNKNCGILWKNFFYGRGVSDCEEPIYSYNNFTKSAKLRYRIGEVVAVSQSYDDAGYLANWKYDGDIPHNEEYDPEWRADFCRCYGQVKGWNNKLLVKASLMPHQIEITGIKLERLQDISDEDCIKEGIREHLKNVQYAYVSKIGYCGQYPFSTPRSAFAALADKLFGKGTWEQNPYVISYEFKLIK